MNTSPTQHPAANNNRFTTLILIITALASLIFATQSTLQPDPNRFFALLHTLITQLPISLLWLITAAGLGYPIRQILLPNKTTNTTANSLTPSLCQLALGSALLLFIDWLLLLLAHPNHTTAIITTAIGSALLITQLITNRHQLTSITIPANLSLSSTLILIPSIFAIALITTAATISPGILWSSEFAAYDVLSYHLQLPKHWLNHNQTIPLTHNVYSYLPNLFESAYTHLALFAKSVPAASYSCQLLHSTFAILTALTLTQLSSTICSVPLVGSSVPLVGSSVPLVGSSVPLFDRNVVTASSAVGSTPPEQFTTTAHSLTPFALYLTIPWTLVTASLAYNEQAALFFAAVATLFIFQPALTTLRRFSLIAFFSAIAFLIKPSALTLITIPLFIASLLHFRLTHRPRPSALIIPALIFIITFTLTIAPYLVRNYIWTTTNPLFPFAADIFSSAHWTTEQAARFSAAHSPSLTDIFSLSTLTQILHHQFAYIIFPLAIIAVIILLKSLPLNLPLRIPALTLTTILLLQLILWLTTTHAQSRFLIPLLIPAVLLISLALTTIIHPILRATLTTTLILITTFFSIHLYIQHAPALLYIAAHDVIADNIPPNSILNSLPPNSKIYAEGFATPLYIKTPITYHTVWDTSQLGQLINQSDIPAALNQLAKQNYTHILIDHAMIRRWLSPNNYSYDPNITLQILDQIHNTLKPYEMCRGNGLYLYHLPPTQPPTQPPAN